MRRRRFLETGGMALLGGFLGRSAWGGADPPRELLVHTSHPANLATPIGWFDRLITPTDVFFVRSHFGPPPLDPERRLRVEGLVERTLDLGPAELADLPQTTLTAVLQCAGNGRALHEPTVPGLQWGHGAMGQASWTGVRLRGLLERAGVRSGALHVQLEGADRPPGPGVPDYVRSIPLERALDPTTLVALAMNGRPLEPAHGAPLRLVVPGWAGNHWLKWLTAIRVQAEPARGFYMETGYRLPRVPVEPGQAVAPENTVSLSHFPIKSLIARPADGSRIRPGKREVVGVAFSGEAPIERVEVRLDDGDWQLARLEGEPGLGRWQVFRLSFGARPGPMRASARAFDAAGHAQPERAVWNPSGYFWNGWHTVAWEVT